MSGLCFSGKGFSLTNPPIFAPKKARIALVDIETSPMVSYTWGAYEQNVLKILEQSQIICFSHKWLGEKKIHVKSIADYDTYRKGKIDDRKLVRDLWMVLDEADVVIAHNGDSFDIKKSNIRFAAHDFDSPSFYKTIDTKKVAKRYFRFDKNNLGELGLYFAEGNKMSTGGFELWDQCIAGDPKAWAKMKLYNRRDVELLERIYLRLRPFMADHPNLNVIEGTTQACPSCGGKHLQARGFNFTRTGRSQRHQCVDCGAWSSGTHRSAKSSLR